MLRRFLKVLCLCWLFLVTSLSFAATKTVLSFDLSHNNTLAGTWLFQPQKIVSPFQIDLNKSRPVQLPASFLNLTGQANTLGTFEKTFILPDSALNHYIYIYAPYQYGAYRLYVNGNLLINVGQVGDESQHQTEMAPKLASFLVTQRKMTITIQASSFRHMNGGLENNLLIGFSKPILHAFYKQIIPLSMISGVLLMISSFMIIFSLFRNLEKRSGKPLLFLGLFLFCLSLRSFFSVPFIYTLFTDISWLWGTRFEYLLTQLACLFFLTYIYLLQYKLLNKHVYQLTILVIVTNLLITLFSQPIVFQKIFFQSFSIAIVVFINLIYSAYRMHKLNMGYSKLNSIAVILVCLTFIHDFLLALKVIQSVEIAFYTSCIYFILITLQLSRDYAIQSIRTEKLNRKLLRWNKELDRKVQERTLNVSLLNEQLAQQLRLDSLTNAYNRFALNEHLQQQYQQAVINNTALAVYMLDIDYFKKYNDYYGHLKGDFVLQNMVTCIQAILPEHAFFARYGGEEFAIVWANPSKQQACDLAEKLCAAVRQIHIEHQNREDAKTYLTISIGAAVMLGKNDYQNIHDLVKMADQQLYIAKKQRDCAVII